MISSENIPESNYWVNMHRFGLRVSSCFLFFKETENVCVWFSPVFFRLISGPPFFKFLQGGTEWVEGSGTKEVLYSVSFITQHFNKALTIKHKQPWFNRVMVHLLNKSQEGCCVSRDVHCEVHGFSKRSTTSIESKPIKWNSKPGAQGSQVSLPQYLHISGWNNIWKTKTKTKIHPLLVELLIMQSKGWLELGQLFLQHLRVSQNGCCKQLLLSQRCTGSVLSGKLPGEGALVFLPTSAAPLKTIEAGKSVGEVEEVGGMEQGGDKTRQGGSREGQIGSEKGMDLEAVAAAKS